MNEDVIQQVASRLHGSAARLVRQVRIETSDGGTGGARLSALSSIISSGPLSLGELAAAEHVRAPTMSRVVEGLVRDRLVTRETHGVDRRQVRISATEEGRAFLHSTRRSQVGSLAERLRRLGESEKRALLRGVELMERITRI